MAASARERDFSSSAISMAKKRKKANENSVYLQKADEQIIGNNRLTIQKEYIILADRGKRKERHL